MAISEFRNSDQFAFKDIELKVDGVKQVTVQSITYGTSIDKAYTYGEGDQPRSIQKANQSHQGEFTLLQTDFETLTAKGILNGYFDINVTYTIKTSDGAEQRLVKDIIHQAQVMDINKGMNQGDYNSTHTFTFIALGVTYDKRGYVSPVVSS